MSIHIRIVLDGAGFLTAYSYGMVFEAQCQQLDTFCHRLEDVAAQLVQASEALSMGKNNSQSASAAEELQQAAHALQSLPRCSEVAQAVPAVMDKGDRREEMGPDPSSRAQYNILASLNTFINAPSSPSAAEEIEKEPGEGAMSLNESQDQHSRRFGSLVPDSYGRFRSGTQYLVGVKPKLQG